MWQWIVASKTDAREVAKRILPWMCARRKGQVEAIVAATDKLVIQPEGYRMNGHRIDDANRQGKACRRCINERRRRQRATHRV